MKLLLLILNNLFVSETGTDAFSNSRLSEIGKSRELEPSENIGCKFLVT